MNKYQNKYITPLEAMGVSSKANSFQYELAGEKQKKINWKLLYIPIVVTIIIWQPVLVAGSILLLTVLSAVTRRKRVGGGPSNESNEVVPELDMQAIQSDKKLEHLHKQYLGVLRHLPLK
jgi:hypothetical protein